MKVTFCLKNGHQFWIENVGQIYQFMKKQELDNKLFNNKPKLRVQNLTFLNFLKLPPFESLYKPVSVPKYNQFVLSKDMYDEYTDHIVW